MSRRYRLQYSDEALDALKKMTSKRRRRFDAEIAQVAADPYAYGSAVGGNRDRRQAPLAGTVTVYWVSHGVLTVTVVRIAHTD
ncbi:type II toxin-antitoxin system RelE family toxin [Streptomyces mayteni]